MKQTKLKKSLIVPAVALCLTLAQPTLAQTVMVANAAQTDHKTIQLTWQERRIIVID